MNALDRLQKGLERDGGQLVVADNGSDGFVVSLTFGREAPDSDMAGAAAYGMGATVTEALGRALDEAGW